MRSHGLRKHALTRMKKAGIDFSDRHALLGHKSNISNDLNYDRTEDSDRLLAYVKAIPYLTIDPTSRLQQKVQNLEGQQAQEIDKQSREINTLKTQLSKLNQKYSERRIIRATEDGGFTIDMKNLEKVESEIKTLRTWFKEMYTPAAKAAAAAVEADRIRSKSKIKT